MPSSDFTDARAFARLLMEARMGSSDALGRALMECHDYLLRAADCKLDPELRQKASSADLVQETYLEALRDFARFQGERMEELQAWLCQILFYNVANTVRRYRDTAKRAVERELPLQEMTSDTPRPIDRVAAREEAMALVSALSRLPEHYRRLLFLRYQEQQTYAQIGATLNCSAESARKLWTRAVILLRKMLEPLQESSLMSMRSGKDRSKRCKENKGVRSRCYGS